MKVAVVSANFGNYDSVKEQSNIKEKELFDWYYFTDNLNIISNTYKIITTRYHNHTYNMNVLFGKYYKLQSHKIDILSNYDYIIWMDASIQILNPNFVNDILDFLKNKPNLVMFAHEARTKIKDEVTVLNKISKFRGLNFNQQLKTYYDDGFKDDYGLYSSGFFIRKNNDDGINKLYDDWWNEVTTQTYRDQVSLSYVLWKNNIRPDIIIKQNIFKNKLIGNVIKHIK
ncbi:protein of unknown function DUF616 [Indivirus ILV1]|uniref:TOD1/MUCI70 glycosyltransferase-like domain-containing protein n=1 Tax=Indivirus ILV1 TaxID=1977633 RepID=A0A1V0SE58_9VIRU|nr:protein of unknown function DUF616 [Indivirus ILV1]